MKMFFFSPFFVPFTNRWCRHTNTKRLLVYFCRWIFTHMSNANTFNLCSRSLVRLHESGIGMQITIWVPRRAAHTAPASIDKTNNLTNYFQQRNIFSSLLKWDKFGKTHNTDIALAITTRQPTSQPNIIKTNFIFNFDKISKCELLVEVATRNNKLLLFLPRVMTNHTRIYRCRWNLQKKIAATWINWHGDALNMLFVCVFLVCVVREWFEMNSFYTVSYILEQNRAEWYQDLEKSN